MYIKYFSSFIQCCFYLSLFLFGCASTVSADTTVYRSAGWIETDGDSAYLSTSGCRASNDGLYCSHSYTSGFANLYFSSFGTLEDFRIPHGSTLTTLHMRAKGKNTVGQYIGLIGDKNTHPFTTQCQKPTDLWQFSLGNSENTSEFHISIAGNSLANCLTTENIDLQNLTFRINYSSGTAWSSDIDNFEIAFDYTPPTSTPTPSPTILPTPTAIPAPAPFLDLPWDYKGKGLTFNDAALAINSYFDHEYPLQSRGLDLAEPIGARNTIIPFMGKPRRDIPNDKFWYSGHDGYDYGIAAGVYNGDPVYPASSGIAEYKYDKAGGNTILIDHRNGYQTRYYHLQDNSTIVTVPGEKREVTRSSVIGRVGSTGTHVDGPHIHIGVFWDKNYKVGSQANFVDYEPEGATDPFGWQSKEPDPWENYSFFYNGKQRIGNKSYYLWAHKIDHLNESLPSNGGIFNLGRYNLQVPADISSQHNLILEMQSTPVVNPSASLVSIVPSMNITMRNSLGDLITLLNKHFYIQIDFSGVDISRYKLGRIGIYSSLDQIHWDKEQTTIDQQNKKASTDVGHLTYFAFMGERKDIIPPVTTIKLQGLKGQDNWYRTDISLSLVATDSADEDPAGIAYTLYKEDNKDWQTYSLPLIFNKEGHHIVSYYSGDKDGNLEQVKSVEFEIDKTAPEAGIGYDLVTFDSKIVGKDSSSSATVNVSNGNLLQPKYTISDKAGNKTIITTDKVKVGKQVLLSVKNIQYNTNAIIKLDDNVFFTLVASDTKNKLKQIDQYFTLKNDKKVFTLYSSLSNTTKFYTRIPGPTSYWQETKQGIALLQLETKNGTINYSY